MNILFAQSMGAQVDGIYHASNIPAAMVFDTMIGRTANAGVDGWIAHGVSASPWPADPRSFIVATVMTFPSSGPAGVAVFNADGSDHFFHAGAGAGWGHALVRVNSVVPTPEPATAWLMGSGLVGLIGLSKVKKKTL